MSFTPNTNNGVKSILLSLSVATFAIMGCKSTQNEDPDLSGDDGYSIEFEATNGGSVTTADFEIAEGKKKAITAEAETGYAFDKWESDPEDACEFDDASDSSTRISCIEDAVITATFKTEGSPNSSEDQNSSSDDDTKSSEEPKSSDDNNQSSEEPKSSEDDKQSSSEDTQSSEEPKSSDDNNQSSEEPKSSEDENPSSDAKSSSDDKISSSEDESSSSETNEPTSKVTGLNLAIDRTVVQAIGDGDVVEISREDNDVINFYADVEGDNVTSVQFEATGWDEARDEDSSPDPWAAHGQGVSFPDGDTEITMTITPVENGEEGQSLTISFTIRIPEAPSSSSVEPSSSSSDVINPNPEWQKKASHTGATRHHTATFHIGTKGYIAVGNTTYGKYTAEVWEYETTTDKWKQLSNFPGGSRGYTLGATAGNYGYMAFGRNGSNKHFNDLWRFDGKNWEQLADCICDVRAHPVFLVNGNGTKFYAGLGKDYNYQGNGGIHEYKDWYEYDIATDKWTKKKSFPGSVRHHPFHFAIGDYVYVGLGHSTTLDYTSAANGKRAIYKELYRYDPSNDTWTEVAPLPAEQRVAGAQLAHLGKGYVMAGQDKDHYTFSENEVWIYDPEKDSWKQGPSIPGGGRWAPSAFRVGNSLFFTSGELKSKGNQRDLWELAY